MKPRSLHFMAASMQGRLLRGEPGLELCRVSTDTRSVQPGDLFIALAGERYDAHAFLPEAVAKGAAAVVMQDGRAELPGGHCGVILVPDTRLALLQFAAAHRSEFGIPVIAVTGSNGKTTTKEMVGRVLSQRFPTLVNEASFNNDIGVPLTLLRLDAAHEAAVLEAGTNHPGELAPLLDIIRPQYGLLTSIGREHLEHFGDLNGVVAEEGAIAEAVPVAGTLFLNGDTHDAGLIAGRCRGRVVRVGLGRGSDWRAASVRVDTTGTVFQVEAPDARFAGEYRLQLLGRHQVTNALLALAVGAHLGLSAAELHRGLLECPPAKMRLQLWSARGVIVLDDSYNANADSMAAALETLRELRCQARRVAVLGDMAELGTHAEAAHAEVGRLAAQSGIDHLFAVGVNAERMAGAARAAGLPGVTAIADVAAAAAAIRNWVQADDLVLIKASRSTRLERVGQALKG
jgi:UDP-N-acetylmuramoyl-tripeptide--D-alanyl-D-alanine ligase